MKKRKTTSVKMNKKSLLYKQKPIMVSKEANSFIKKLEIA